MITSDNIVCLAGKVVNLCVLRNDEQAMELYTRWNNDSSINMWIGHNSFVESLPQIRRLYQQTGNANSFIWGIMKIPEQVLIGLAELRYSHRNRNAELTVYIGDKTFHRRGCGTEVTQLLLSYAFEELNAHRASLSILGDNIASIACAKKNGFVKCGEEHDAVFYNGHYCSMIHMEMLRSFWKQSSSRCFFG